MNPVVLDSSGPDPCAKCVTHNPNTGHSQGRRFCGFSECPWDPSLLGVLPTLLGDLADVSLPESLVLQKT